MSSRGKIPDFFRGESSSAPNSPHVGRKRVGSPEQSQIIKKQREMDEKKDDDLLRRIGELIEQKQKNLASKEDVALIRGDIVGLTAELERVKRDNEEIKVTVRKLENERGSMVERYDEMDQRMRKNNLVIRGVVCGGKVPTAEDLVTFFANQLGVSVAVESFSVQYAAAESGERKSLIIISFTRTEDKWKVLKQTKKLQGSPGNSIDQDYIEKTRIARSKMFKLRKLIRNNDSGERSRVINDRLQWRGENFTWCKEDGLSCNNAAGLAILLETTKKTLEEINEFLKEDSPSRGPRQRQN